MIKKNLSSLAIRKVVEEAKVLEGAFFQKAYQLDYGTIVLRFAKRKEKLADASEENPLASSLLDEYSEEDKEGISLGEGSGKYVRFDLYFKMGGFLFFSSRIKSNMPKEPSPFAMKLRKSLNNRIVKDISQLEMDRVVVLTFNPLPGELEDRKIYMELFGDGNMIVVKDDTIETAFTSRTWSSRTVKKGEEFIPPPSGIDPFKMEKYEFMIRSRSSTDDLVRFLIRRLNLPPNHAEEVCHRAGMEKKSTVSSMNDDELETLWKSFRDLLSEVSGTEGGWVHFQQGQPTLIEPCFISSVYGVKNIDRVLRKMKPKKIGGKGDFYERFPSINEAVERYMFEDSSPAAPKEKSKEKRLDKLKRLLKSQQKSRKEREREAEESKVLADALYMDYQRIDGLLNGFDRDEYSEDDSRYPDVVSFTPDKRGSGYIKVGIDTEKGHREIQLNLYRDINENAEHLYEKSKKARRKLEGIDKALEMTREKIESAKKDEADLKDADESERKKLRKFWFENFRWCFSSEGVLMVAGKDAKSNERVVKKYMRDDDIYAHADVSGAASVVVRVEPESEITDITKEQACHLSVLHSRAWNSKIGSAGGYWVTPDQVSRTPQSGEFVARGSFIIRGKKNMASKLPLVGAAGTIYVEGVPKVMFGPEDAVKEISNGNYFRLRPGRRKKSDVAKMIAGELGGEIDQVMSQLPADDMDYEKVGRD